MSFRRILAVAFVSGSVMAALPALAAEQQAPAALAGAPHAHRGESHILKLHDALKLTKDQEPQWENVAKAMREEQSTVRELAHTRHDNIIRGINAVESEKAYLTIAQAKAAGLAKVVAAFEPFYNSLSAEQKKAADAYFATLGKRTPHKPAPGTAAATK